MRPAARVTVAAFAITLVGCADSPVELPPGDASALHAEHARGRGSLTSETLAELAQVRRATARYHNIALAFDAGYRVWSPDPFSATATCASSPEGKMGYHLVNPDLRGSPLDPANADATLDPIRPEMLLYEKRADGKLHLVGVEYLVFKAAWEREHGENAPNPQLLGQTVPFSSHAFPPLTADPVDHYELHVWIWKPNPNGMFSHWNPRISC
jgi:hypothetical protein